MLRPSGPPGPRPRGFFSSRFLRPNTEAGTVDLGSTSDPLLATITRRIVDAFDPDRILLFGSRAREDTHADSDYDLLIVMDSELPPAERAMAIDELFGLRHWAMDVFVYTPAEVHRWGAQVGTVAYTAVHEGRVIYER